jgi:hypothetical protein
MTIVTYTAVDMNGVTTSCNFEVTVTDAEAPAVSACPSNMTVRNAPGMANAPVSWTPPSATDNCPPPPQVTCIPPPGSFFRHGVTTVVCTAIDGSGYSATCTFTVEIVADWKPEVSYAVGSGPLAVILADLGSGLPSSATPLMPDGHLDIVTADGAGSLTIRFNDGSAGFNDTLPDMVVSDNTLSGKVWVLCAVVRALGNRYGTPCGGILGTPHISAAVKPIHGFTADILVDDGPAAAGYPDILVVSPGPLETVLGGSCSVYVAPPTYILTSPPAPLNGLGQLHFTFPVPLALFTGFSLYFQAAIFDPGAILGIAFTEGLHARVGY